MPYLFGASDAGTPGGDMICCCSAAPEAVKGEGPISGEGRCKKSESGPSGPIRSGGVAGGFGPAGAPPPVDGVVPEGVAAALEDPPWPAPMGMVFGSCPP